MFLVYKGGFTYSGLVFLGGETPLHFLMEFFLTRSKVEVLPLNFSFFLIHCIKNWSGDFPV